MDGPKSTSSPEFEYADPSKIAISEGADLVTVTVTTREGAIYSFPDMSRSSLKKVLPETGRKPTNQPALMLVNASTAVLSVPIRIVRRVSVGDDVLWESP